MADIAADAYITLWGRHDGKSRRSHDMVASAAFDNNMYGYGNSEQDDEQAA